VKYLSVCSGIEAATVAWHPLGWHAVAFSEIEKFPCAVLAHHYPTVPNWGDLTKFKDWPDATLDLLVGGTPCQSFSVAGLRKGLADPRGNLALTYLAVADRYRPEWLVWENVPGVLSADDGRAFGAFLGGLVELGYGWAYRVLDAQHFGVAQRRKRVFVVASARGWQRAAAVLFDSASVRGDSPPSREAGQRVTGTIASRTSAGGGLGTDFDCDGGVIHCEPVSRALTACETATGRLDPNEQEFIAHSLRADGFDASEDGTGRGTPLVPIAFAHQTAGDHTTSMPIENDFCPTLKAGPSMAIAFDARQSDVIQYGYKTGPLDTYGHSMAIGFQSSQSGVRQVDAHATLDSNNGSRRHNGVVQGMAVRRLTPRECERLQGFPDDYTLIPYRGKLAADGPRYKALGNSMAVPCMAWIGRRIAQVHELDNQQRKPRVRADVVPLKRKLA